MDNKTTNRETGVRSGPMRRILGWQLAELSLGLRGGGSEWSLSHTNPSSYTIVSVALGIYAVFHKKRVNYK